MKDKIVVVGSVNIDMVVKSNKFPEAGETLIGGKFFKFPGGKGANQAVAAARLGGDVIFVCKVGDDDFGKHSVQLYETEGINTDYVLIDHQNPTGVALISVNGAGENKIVVAPGANSGFSLKDIGVFEGILSEAAIIVLQLEIPIKIIVKIVELAAQFGVRVILNPAPVQKLSRSVFEDLFLITPNEIEAKHLTGITIEGKETVRKAAQSLQAMGVKNIVITLGKQGAYMLTNEHTGFISTPKVKAIDTTAAGDIFNGALAVGLTQGRIWQDAVKFACRAAAVSVTKNGAQSSAPSLEEVNSLGKNLAEKS